MNRCYPTSSLPYRTLFAVLLSALLIAGGVLAAGHSHDDGRTHYVDCDICVQVGGLDAGHETSTTLPALRAATFHPGGYAVPASTPTTHTQRARAPPLTLSL